MQASRVPSVNILGINTSGCSFVLGRVGSEAGLRGGAHPVLVF